MRYYVDNSSYFDAHPYNTVRIAKAVKNGGGTNVRTSLKYGWRNQPSVVTFTATPSKLKAISKAVESATGARSIFIREKGW